MSPGLFLFQGSISKSLRLPFLRERFRNENLRSVFLLERSIPKTYAPFSFCNVSRMKTYAPFSFGNASASYFLFAFTSNATDTRGGGSAPVRKSVLPLSGIVTGSGRTPPTRPSFISSKLSKS